VAIFWALMSAPIVVVYREYFATSWNVFTGQAAQLNNFPQPTAGLFFTSLALATLPLAIYCMVVLTCILSRKKIRRIAREIGAEHEKTMDQLQADDVI